MKVCEILIFIFMLKTAYSKFHLSISPEERKSIFGTYDLNVPDYELVQIGHSIKTRETNENKNVLKFNAFGKSRQLELNKKKSVFLMDTPIWLARGNNSSSNIQYTRVDNDTLHDALLFYEDPNNLAEVLVIKDPKRGNMEFMMHIRDRTGPIIVSKAPSSVIEKWKEFFKKSKNSRVSRSAETQYVEDYHIAINWNNVNQSYRPELNPVKNQYPSKKVKLSPYKGPNPIYIRTLLIINYGVEYVSDTDLYLYKLLVYLVSFWNAVNLKFYDFVNPSIKFHISGVVIANNKWATPYLQDSFEPSGTYIQSLKAIHNFHDFLSEKNQQKIFNSTWDIAITQTNLKLCQPNLCDYESSVGVAYINQTCNNKYKTDSPIAIINDSNDFGGVITAAHEIGHILGINHDGIVTSKNTSCTPDGFIMESSNAYINGPNSNTWSSCSILEILTIFRNQCWVNHSIDNQSENVPEILPGHMISLSDQCKSRRFTDACDESQTTCEKLYCWNSINYVPNFLQECLNAGAPLSGTYCGVNKHCINQKCEPIDGTIL